MLEIRPAQTDDDLAELARIVTATVPENPLTVEEIRWADAHYPGGRRFVAWLDGEPVGAGGAGRVYMYPPDYDGLWGSISVLPAFRRRGVGSAILAAIGGVAREAGKSTLIGRTSADRPEAIEFAEHRGFRETERMKAVRLELAGLEPPAVDPIEGIQITSLAERPDLVPGVYAVAIEAFPDIPGEGPVAPESLDAFREREVDRPGVPAGGFAVAVESGSDRVVGYASLLLTPGRPEVAWHDMTAVARAWRGRGIARALKLATIRWAASSGLQALEGANDVANAPMRAVNRRLGYQPLPDEIMLRGTVPAAE